GEGRRGGEQGKGDVDALWPPGGALAVLLPKEKQGRMAEPAFNGATKSVRDLCCRRVVRLALFPRPLPFVPQGPTPPYDDFCKVTSDLKKKKKKKKPFLLHSTTQPHYKLL
ncbi:hypothetical protein B296_00034714, partial [Ensete ventricosum]